MSFTISIPVSAEWNKESDKWIWMENGQKINGWKQVDNKWYHFDENGYMNTGWFKDNDKWYRFNDDGEMSTGWELIDDKWYYFNNSGVMQTEWVQDNEKWYYMSSDGNMNTGWVQINGEWYMFDDSGIMKTGWIDDNGTWYYAGINGKLEKGELSIDGKVYKFSEGGALISENETNSDKETIIDSKEDYTITGYVNTNSGILNVRSDSDVNSAVLGKLPKGTEIIITGERKNGFYPIKFNNMTAWVSADWISFDKPADNNESFFNSSSETNKDTVVDRKESEGNSVENNDKDKPKEDIKVTLGGIRTTEPDKNDIHYYSDSNIFYKVRLSPPFFKSTGEQIKGNCTWYAWGRIWELTGKQPTEANLIGNAYEWWNANLKSGKYRYGSEPKVGAIAVWKADLPGSGGFGHVAVVEKVDNDKVYISESAWHGECFNYQEIYSKEYLYGYIYIDEPNY